MKLVVAINFHSPFEHLHGVVKVVLAQNIKILKISDCSTHFHTKLSGRVKINLLPPETKRNSHPLGKRWPLKKNLHVRVSNPGPNTGPGFNIRTGFRYKT